jgi:hypothetical protein
MGAVEAVAALSPGNRLNSTSRLLMDASLLRVTNG